MGKPGGKKAGSLSRAPSEVKGFKFGHIDDKDLKQSGQTFRWSLNVVDTSEPWGLTAKVLKKKWCSKNGLLKALVDRETMTWAQISNQSGGRKTGTNSHHVSVSGLRKEARKFLKESSLDDLDEIYSLRLNSKERLYGIIQDYVFYILWYDPKHEIYPTKKK